MSVRDAALAPCVQPLMRQFELRADRDSADCVDEFAMGMPVEHSPLLNAALSFVNRHSLIEGGRFVAHTALMLNELATRIQHRMAELDASQTDLASSAGMSVQRLNNYLGKRRMPDVPTLARIANALNTSMDWLVGAEDARFALYQDVLAEILEAADMPRERADVILRASEEAMRLLAVLPDEGGDQLRSRMAARAAWHQRRGPRPQ